jgi:hypothetical protein
MLARLAIVGLCALAALVALFWATYAAISGSPRYWPLARAFDRVGNVATGGVEEDMVTERAARGSLEGKRRWCLLCKLLDKVDPGHCTNALTKRS